MICVLLSKVHSKRKKREREREMLRECVKSQRPKEKEKHVSEVELL